MSEKTFLFCDFCGKRITKKNKIRTPWKVLVSNLVGFTSMTEVAGDGCKECYKSYKLWLKSREVKTK